MKKLLVMAMIAVLAFTFVACDSASKTDAFVDGTYTAQMSEGSYGWVDQLEVTYKDGVVTNAAFESISEDGAKKSEAKADEYPMDPLPSVWIPQLSENIVAAGNSADIEGVAGATVGSTNAKAMMAAIEEAAKAGKSADVIVVEVPAEG